MSITREQFEAAEAAFRDFVDDPSHVEIDDYPANTPNQQPYRYLTLKSPGTTRRACAFDAGKLADLAMTHNAHLSMHVFEGLAWFSVSVACDLANFEPTS